MSATLNSVKAILKEMPFKSESQRRYLWKNEPELARKWAHKYGRKAIRKQAIQKIKQSGKSTGNS